MWRRDLAAGIGFLLALILFTIAGVYLGDSITIPTRPNAIAAK